MSLTKTITICTLCVNLCCGGTIKEFGGNLKKSNNVQYFNKDKDFGSTRVTRNTVAIAPCENVVTSSGVLKNITCCCDVKDVTSVIWYVNNEATKGRLGQSYLSNFTQTTNLSCHVPTTNCSSTVIVVISNQSSGGLTAFLIILFLCIFIVFSSCFIKRNKDHVYVLLRDTFAKNDGTDGMLYDAFISSGKGDANKLIEGLLRDTLSRKCGYNLLLDDSNMLPQLDYNPKIQANIHKCRRLVVIFSASYLTNDWCMYCMGEGLRKIVQLKIPTIFIITEYNILRELRAFSDIISGIPQILLCHEQPSRERRKAVNTIQRLMPAVPRNYARAKGMRTPILSDVEDTHRKSDANLNFQNGTGSYKPEAEVEYAFPEDNEEDAEAFVDAVEAGDEINPNSIQVREFRDRKDLYTLTVMDDME